MKSFKEFCAEADTSKKEQLKGLASEYEHHIRQAAGQHDDERKAEHHATRAQRILKTISDNHDPKTAARVRTRVEAMMKHEAPEAFD